MSITDTNFTDPNFTDPILHPVSIDLSKVRRVSSKREYSSLPPIVSKTGSIVAPEIDRVTTVGSTDRVTTVGFNDRVTTVGFNDRVTSNESGLVNIVPAFAPKKEFSVRGGLTDQLGYRLKSRDPAVREEAMEALERLLIRMQGRCPDDIVTNLKVRTFQLDPESIRGHLSDDGLFDHNFQDGLACFVDAIVSDPDVKRIITDQTLFLNKVPTPSNNLIHEALVGLGALNTLRDRIPNFMHTYGVLFCSEPNVEGCITTLLLENINGKPLSELIRTVTSEEFLQIYIQIVNAINVAYKEYDFTHYDLNGKNVIIQELPYFISIPIYGPTITYLKTKLLARITDYSSSHIYLQGHHFGRFGFEDSGVNPEAGAPLYDVYKLLLWSAYYNTTFKDTLQSIYNFFGEGNLDTKVHEQRTVDYYQTDTLNDFLDYIIHTVPTRFITPSPEVDTILTVCETNCMTWSTFNQTLFNLNELPKNINDYVQSLKAINELSVHSYQANLLKWINQFDLDTIYDYERNLFVSDLNSSITTLNDLEFIQNQPDLKIYHQKLLTVLQLLNKLQNNRNWIISVQKLSPSNNIKELVQNDLNTIKETWGMIRNRLCELKTTMEHNNVEQFKELQSIIVDLIDRLSGDLTVDI